MTEIYKTITAARLAQGMSPAKELIRVLEEIGGREDSYVATVIDILREHDLATAELKALMDAQRALKLARASVVVEAAAALRERQTGRKWFEAAE